MSWTYEVMFEMAMILDTCRGKMDFFLKIPQVLISSSCIYSCTRKEEEEKRKQWKSYDVRVPKVGIWYAGTLPSHELNLQLRT